MLVDNINRKVEKNVSNMGIANFINEEVSASKKFELKINDKATISESNSININEPVYNNPSKSDNTASKNSDNMNKDLMTDSENRKNQMIVLSNTVTADDFREIEKDGFSFSDTDSGVILSESDKIKAALAEHGVDISKYGGLSDKELEAIAGSPELAMQMKASFDKNDVPINEDNLKDMAASVEKIKSMSELSTSAAVYMIRNQLLPTIDNVYKAQCVGSQKSNIVGMTESDYIELKPQIIELLQSEGIEPNEDTLNYARILMDNCEEVNADNIVYLDDLYGLSNELSDIDMEKLYDRMTLAISEGGRPGDGLLIDGYSLIDQAENAYNVINSVSDEEVDYLVQNDKEINVKNLESASKTDKSNYVRLDGDLRAITARRQLEETRLMMTINANYTLLKKGIAIDTKPLVELVEDLKNAENSFYKDMLGRSGGIDSEENIATFHTTTKVIEAIKYQPAYAITLTSNNESFNTIYTRGASLQAELNRASQSYETMMTAPRLDLGDSLDKALRNVDDILKDIGLDITESNQRAVRILAYNETPITPENVVKIKAVDEEVQRAFKNMTPSTTLEMIRKGLSPLDMSIEELNNISTEIQKDNSENDSEKFSKFLYKLEQNKQITREERNSYIGIYRLIAQVEESDGAVIGSLINRGSKITMRNLLTAVRSNYKSKIDYTIDDNFSREQIIGGKKIDEQIESAYNMNCLKDVAEEITKIPTEVIDDNLWENMTPEELKEYITNADEEILNQDEELEFEYAKSKLQEFENIKTMSDDVYRFLDRYDIENSMANILAASRLIKNPNIALRKLWNDINIPADEAEMINQMKSQVMEQFGESVKTPKELADAQEALAEVATRAMDTMIIEGEEVSAQDINELRMINKQLQICTKKAKEESYMIPIETSEGISGISLKVIRGMRNKGFVDIFFRGELMGKIAASLEAKEGGVSGVIAVSDDETRKLVADNIGMLAENITHGMREMVDIRVAYIPEISSEQFEMSSLHKEAQLKEEKKDYVQANFDYKVQTKRLYNIAESFVKTISDLF